MTDSAKFAISLCAAFVIPALTYAYGQGSIDTSLKDLDSKVDRMSSEVITMSNRMYNFNATIAANQKAIDMLEVKTERIKDKVDSNYTELARLK